MTFFALLNLVVCGASTFCVQNPTTAIQELRYYGPVASSNQVSIWIVLRGVIILIKIFFRFHSLVMLVEEHLQEGIDWEFPKAYQSY